MKGTIRKDIDGNWSVWYINKPKTKKSPVAEVNVLPLHSTDVEQIAEWSKVFDNIDSRILSDPEVEFEIIDCIPKDLEPTNGETLSFESIKYAKLFHSVLKPGFEAHDPEDFIDEDTADWERASLEDYIDEGTNEEWYEVPLEDYGVLLDYEDKELLIELEEWEHTCSDGCCYTYGTSIHINGERIEERDVTNPHQLLKAVLTKLGYTNVKVEYK